MSTSPARSRSPKEPRDRSASPQKPASGTPHRSPSRGRSSSPKQSSRSVSRGKRVSPKRNSRPKHNSRSPPSKQQSSPQAKKRTSRSTSPKKRRNSRSVSPKKRSDRKKGKGRSPSRSRSPKRNEETCKLYIGNLSFKTKERDLEDAFRRYGKITDVFIPMETDRDGYQRSRGFAFVTFDREKDADAAVDGMDDGDLQGRQIKVNKAKAREPGESGARSTFARNGREFCRDYERGSCTRGDSCRFAHGSGPSRSRSRSRERRRRSHSRSRGRDRRR